MHEAQQAYPVRNVNEYTQPILTIDCMTSENMRMNIYIYRVHTCTYQQVSQSTRVRLPPCTLRLFQQRLWS